MGIHDFPGIGLNPDFVETDIIIFKFDHPELSADEFIAKLKEKNVLALTTPAKDIRFVTHKDIDVKNTATKYLSGSAEIKRVFKEYLKKWCRNNKFRIKNHQQFISDTEDMFEMVHDRIIDELEHFYPLVRNVSNSQAVI